jgi:transaldolase
LSSENVKDAPAKIALDEKTFRWMMNEDPMATEKLAEGIRTFGHDLGSLRNLVGARLAAAA